MSQRAKLLGAVGVLVAPVLLVLTAGQSDSATTMPSCPVTKLTRTGDQTSQLNQAATDATWNLTGAVWDRVAPSPIAYPVRSDAWTRGCIVGARIYGDVPRSATRDQWYDGEGGTRLGGDGFRQTLTTTPGNYLLLRNTFVSDYEDAYDPNGQSSSLTMYLDHVRAEYIRDDCVENEGSGTSERPMNVVIDDSLFDGCFTGFAERPTYAGNAVQNGSGTHSLTVEDSLMYIRPQPLGPNYCSSSKVSSGRCRPTSTADVWLGAHGIWKWSWAAAKDVTIRNTVFRLDQASYSSCSPQQWPAGSYQDVTLVWTGAGAYSTAGGCRNVLPAGVTLTTDRSVWDNARSAWLARSAPTTGSTSTMTPTRITARANGSRVSGTLARASGHRLSGRTLTLQRRTATSGWVKLTSRRTGDAGVARATVFPRRTTLYRWKYHGVRQLAPATSRAVRVSR